MTFAAVAGALRMYHVANPDLPFTATSEAGGDTDCALTRGYMEMKFRSLSLLRLWRWGGAIGGVNISRQRREGGWCASFCNRRGARWEMSRLIYIGLLNDTASVNTMANLNE
ncbi:hypothetical protein KCP69_19875 [Salmonella enterica subsp. enterica]|nr:hypothetical protein KCP69_19875 [Salmonella enterica subsp. enterica]